MDFIVDAMLPLRLSDFLNNNGHNSIHTLQLQNKNSTSDKDICSISASQKRVLITKDSDFEDEIRINDIPHKLLLIKTGNISNEELMTNFSRNLTAIISALKENRFVELNSVSIITYF